MSTQDIEARVFALEREMEAMRLAVQHGYCLAVVEHRPNGPLYCGKGRPCPEHDKEEAP